MGRKTFEDKQLFTLDFTLVKLIEDKLYFTLDFTLVKIIDKISGVTHTCAFEGISNQLERVIIITDLSIFITLTTRLNPLTT